jgi:signal transduction histidine kinase
MLRRADAPHARLIAYAALVLVVGQVANIAPALAPFNIDNISALGAALLMGVAMLRYNLFMPLAEANAQLRTVVAQLERETQQKEILNRQLKQADQYKNEFLAMMSHELRTPLNAITGYTELLREGIYGALQDDQIDRLDRVLRNSKHLLGLIDDVLDLSKVEAGELAVRPAAVDVARLVARCAEQVTPLAETKGLTLHTEVPGALPPMYADGLRVRQVLGNLLSNAVKFTDAGSVRITARHRVVRSAHAVSNGDGPLPPGDWIVIAIEDTGIGIAEDKQDYIFESFTQADTSPTRKFGGAGVGLALTRRLVELQQGHIWVQSTPGVGSTFTVAMPAANEHDA